MEKLLLLYGEIVIVVWRNCYCCMEKLLLLERLLLHQQVVVVGWRDGRELFLCMVNYYIWVIILELKIKASFRMVVFARLAKFIPQFCKGVKFILHSLALCPAACTPLRHFASLRKFSIAMRNCWMLDSLSDSLPCILD